MLLKIIIKSGVRAGIELQLACLEAYRLSVFDDRLDFLNPNVTSVGADGGEEG
jgi:hypothetical protein